MTNQHEQCSLHKVIHVQIQCGALHQADVMLFLDSVLSISSYVNVLTVIIDSYLSHLNHILFQKILYSLTHFLLCIVMLPFPGVDR